MRQKVHSFSTELGRSMVDMLGVLVIIAVLTIGGIVGYHVAIAKYKATQTLDEVSRRHVVLMMQNMRGKTLNMEEFMPTTSLGYPVTAAVLQDEIKGYKISLTQVPLSVCHQILISNYPAEIRANGQNGSVSCTQENTLDFLFNVNEGWCEHLDEQNNCCDKQGKCCPPDKPLINSSNQCISCQGSQSIHLGADNIYTCSRCANRKAVNYYCAMECSRDKIKDDSGNCRSCDDVAQFYIDKTPDNIAKALACPHLTVSTDFDKIIVRHCNMSNTAFGVHDYAYTCGKCENRESIKLTETGVLCAIKCPENGFRNANNNCSSCDEIKSSYVDRSPDNISKILACPRVVLGDGIAEHCDTASEALDVSDYEYTCAKCNNRILQGSSCVLK